MKYLISTALPLCMAFAAPALAEDFNEAALLEAAKAEPALTIYDSTGKIKEQADAFAAKYGLEAVGTKSKAAATIKIIAGEAQAGNVQADVVIVSDLPAATAQLIEPGYTVSYLPSDMADKIDAKYQSPLIVSTSPDVWAYNTALNDSCPVDNIWTLTDKEWNGRIAMPDPLAKSLYTDWFNQMAMHHDAEIAAAYEAHYGKPLETTLASATEAFVAALAANNPLLTDSDSDVAAAVGAPDTTENFIGIMSTAKFRENENGMVLGICDSMKPMVGLLYPKFMLMTAGTDSPNAAKLFVHYMLTEEGWAPQAVDGKMSTNTQNAVPADEPSGVVAYMDAMMSYDATTSGADWAARQDWQDIWALARQGQLGQ
ncbi:ABC transporter substrate-binding protein [Donghicola sp. C2-DW-16]|uniref:ABC transporter substrate-binding protein n=1 Tax=Donghicola mangrovi TaxID=2729614 RepID=A0A850QFY8_9RHOB|nr:ABC transporter substrate-binding protein [Donghicola mangrovi]NVO25295.1 ABC transporter substrate-binding protein [Donghicola mangrovi]NVO27266.1 ABC transporter substrate-binding protein [Donghicola mangrovi]